MGYSKEELIGKNSRILKSGIHQEAFYKNLWTTLLSGKPWQGLVCNKKKDGSLIWGDTIITPCFSENNQIDSFLVMRTNVTQAVENELLLKVQEKHLINASKYTSLGEMVSFIAHEIKSPLATVTYVMDKILKESKNNDVEKISDLSLKVKTILDKVFKLIAGLRHLSYDDSKLAFQKEKPIQIVYDAVIILGPFVQNAGVEFIIENNIPDGTAISCHPIQLSQVLINLINNAFHAIKDQSNSWIKLVLLNEGQNILFKVINSGPRINAEIEKNLFTPFFTSKGESSGTGLGLTISRRIAEKHNGNLIYKPENESTCFVLVIPLNA
jgi:PAS domain S-box-containing protein